MRALAPQAFPPIDLYLLVLGVSHGLFAVLLMELKVPALTIIIGTLFRGDHYRRLDWGNLYSQTHLCFPLLGFAPFYASFPIRETVTSEVFS